MYTSDWTQPPQTRGEWLYRLGVTLLLTLGLGTHQCLTDIDALYAEGATYQQAAVACARMYSPTTILAVAA